MSLFIILHVILLIFPNISHTFFIHTHQKYSRYHRNNMQSNHFRVFRKTPHFTTNYYHFAAPTIHKTPQIPQIDIRGAFSDISYGLGGLSQVTQRMPSRNQCNFRPDHFGESIKNAFCTWKNQLIIIRNEGVWCVGFMTKDKKNKKNPVLFLKFDRSYQVRYVSFSNLISIFF